MHLLTSKLACPSVLLYGRTGLRLRKPTLLVPGYIENELNLEANSLTTLAVIVAKMNKMETHFRKLERMYLSAPVNIQLYKGISISISKEKAVLTLKVEEKFFHAANAIHGSVYFKMLDDAAFFAVNSVVQDFFVYTVSLTVQLLRPVSGGIIRSAGELKFKSNNLFIADSSLFDENNKLAGKATGSFMKSKIELTESIGYK